MRIDSTIIKNGTASALCLTLAICAVVATREVRATNAKVSASADEIHTTSKVLREYIEFQTEQLKSPRNQKSIEASLQTAAIVNGTFRLVNTQTLPRVHATIDQLQSTTRSLNLLVRNSDFEINRNLLPAATKTLKTADSAIAQYGNAAVEINKTIALLAVQGQIAISDLHKLLSDPVWQSTLVNIEKSSISLAGMTEESRRLMMQMADAGTDIRQGAKEVPGIMQDVHKFTTTTNQREKVYRALRLIVAASQIAIAFANN